MKPTTPTPELPFLVCVAEICVWEKYPMELNENRQRFGAEINYFYEGTEFVNHKDSRNKSIVRKKVGDAILIASKWKRDIERKGLVIRNTGLWTIDGQSCKDFPESIKFKNIQP